MTARRFAVLATIGLALLAALAFWLLPDAQQAEGSLLRPDDKQIVAAGAAIYQANCASCHGVDLKGQPNWQAPGEDGLMPAPPHDETGHTWHHPDEILFAITKHGVAKAANLKDYKSAMPVYEGVLSDEEMIAALSWIKAQWPGEVRQRHDEMNAQYQALEKEAYK
ncbi:c-type cytochrome [Oricola nitratireducens]|uniref:c-type cytochrome n=1 Tax=Oricola nitratireducens TaxID=2775868 RepID=UPI001867FF1C|nr:cytochrome c [Oricola nitratireducens]